MDKYEYNLKLEEIDKLVDQEDYQEAANLADTIDWRRVRNIRTLCLISEIYEAAGRLEAGITTGSTLTHITQVTLGKLV